MIYTLQEFDYLEKTYGEFSTWAIWDHSKGRTNEKSTDCIRQNLTALNSRYVVRGLNSSSKIDIWGNFRGGRHDRKLKYALNDSIIRGSYMTDLFKIGDSGSKDLIINANSNLFYKSIKEAKKLIDKNVELFVKEMADIKISSDTVFILMGTEDSILGKLYRQFFQMHFPDHKVIYNRHYSSRGTDKDWVERFWKNLGIKNNFDQIKDKYC